MLPFFYISSIKGYNLLLFLLHTMVIKLLAANNLAIDAPKPSPAPIITTTFFFTTFISSISLGCELNSF